MALVAGLRQNKLNVLGHDLLDFSVRKLRNIGVKWPAIIPEDVAGGPLSLQVNANGRPPAWERAVTDCLQQRTEVLFLLRGSAYADLDYSELLRFHLERKAALTQVFAPDGPLDIAVVNTAALRGKAGYKSLLRQLVPNQERFYCRGYVNRLRKPQDVVTLIEDALYGRCNLRPNGSEVASGIWFGPGAEVDDSCVIASPSFIGAQTRVGASCTVSAGSAIERACRIDSGTTVEQSWILQGTYVGVGLNIRRTIVSNSKIFHLDRKTEIAIADRRLIGARSAIPFRGAIERFSARLQLGRLND
jgi:NDP-sugar pyrophosphorylase family protein